MAETKSTKKDQPMLDPIAYRSDYPEENIIWATPATKEVTEKYIGEGTNNVYHPYNKNLTIDQLDTNYQYGQPAKDINAIDDSYITRRNDMIASALYNEWKVWYNDVVSFLQWQRNWYNSTEEDRATTTANVWNRLGQISAGNPKEENKEADTSRMESDLNKDTSGVIYGKTTADSGNPEKGIQTSSDANSAFKIMDEARIANVKSLLSMSTDAIATSIWLWDSTADSQAMVDYQSYYPELWAAVKAKIEQLKWQKAVNDITNWSADYATADIESKEKQTENDKKNKAESVATSSEEADSIIRDLNQDLSNNPSATTAEDTMARLTDEMNKLKTRLKNLNKEAHEVFKWDASDQLVKAYINNRTQEINDRLKELQYDYDSAYQRNRDAIDDAWKWREYWLKQDQLEMQKSQQSFNEWYQRQTLAKSSVVKDDNWVYWQINMNEDGTVYYTKVDQVQNYSNSWMKGKWLKNNNPWNIKDDTFWNVIWHDDSWFAIFATPEDWFDALVEKIKYNQTNPNSRYYWTTIREYFKIYAPSEDWNNPNSYAQSVAKALWVSVDTPISKLDPVEFAKVIANHDSGYNYSTYGQFRKWWANIDLNDIEVPDSVYVQNNWYMEWKVDPNSDEWKQLAQEYRESKAKELWYNISDTWELVPDADWKGTAAYKVISSDWVTPISFRQRIYNLVPATLKNNETELSNLYEIAKQLYEADYSADEASMVFYWLDPRDDTTWLLKPLVYLARTSWRKLWDDFYWNLWSLLESWNSKQAIRLVENTVLSDKEKEVEQKASSIVSKAQSLEVLLQNAESLVWPIDKPLNKLVEDWLWNEDYARLAADIDYVYWQLRNELLWANITEWEQEIYTNMFPKMEDKVSTIKEKLKSTKKAYLKDVNAIRKMYDLPTVNQYTLVDYGLRAELYKQLEANA